MNRLCCIPYPPVYVPFYPMKGVILMRTLLSSMRDIYQYKKFIVLCGTCAAFAGFTPDAAPADAAYIVKDPQNIAETVKNVQQAIKIYTATREQVDLLVKQITGLPKAVLTRLQGEARESTSDLGKVLKTAGGMIGGEAGKVLEEAGNADAYFGKMFPVLGKGPTGPLSGDATVGPLPEISTSTQVDAKQQSNANMAQANMQGVKALRILSDRLQVWTKTLQDLEELNASPEGQKAAQQITNQIGVAQGHIQAIQTNIQAIQAQQKIFQMQKEAQDKQNDIAASKANAAAEASGVDKIIQERSSRPLMNAAGQYVQ